MYPYLQRTDGDWGLAYLTWFALTHPEHFMQHASKLLPYQFHHSGNTDVEHQHEHAYFVKLLGGKDLSQLSMAELSAARSNHSIHCRPRLQHHSSQPSFRFRASIFH
jgi:hypothetical protein